MLSLLSLIAPTLLSAPAAKSKSLFHLATQSFPGMVFWVLCLLVIFSVILALALIAVVEELLPFTKNLLASADPGDLFWFHWLIVLLLVFFGYQTPRVKRFAEPTKKAEEIRETLLGFFVGAITGYMVVGTLWFYMDKGGYPFQPYITSPINDPLTGEAAMRVLKAFPPALWLGNFPGVIVSVVIAFIFVIIVFL